MHKFNGALSQFCALLTAQKLITCGWESYLDIDFIVYYTQRFFFLSLECLVQPTCWAVSPTHPADYNAGV